MSHLVPIVIEKSGRGERAYDIYSRLLKDRIVFVGGGIDDDIANLVIAHLLFLANEDQRADIHLYINSPGGSVSAGMAMIDTMNYIQPDVSTYIIGQAASMGSLLACSGAKGKRYSLPNSRNLLHQPLLSGTMEGQATDIEIEAREMLRIRGLPESQTKRMPPAVILRPKGELKWAALPRPSAKPLCPGTPASVVTTPLELIFRMAWLSLSAT